MPMGSSARLMLLGSGAESIPEGLEAQKFQKPNKLMPTYTLLQKVWNKTKQLQDVHGFMTYSPIWDNSTYAELAKIQQGPQWGRLGITHLKHIFHNGALLPFRELQSKYALPSNMLFYYLQLLHAVKAQGDAVEWTQSSTPVFHILQDMTDTKGVISQCYNMLLGSFLDGYPMKVVSQLEADLGPIGGELWEEALQAVNICSLNVAQKVSQLYVLLRVHYTPVKLYKMGKTPDPLCGRCRVEPGDLIHLLWRCPKLHRYWTEVLATLNQVFQTKVPLDPMSCLLGILEGVIEEEGMRIAFARALFQARKTILMNWKSAAPPKTSAWIQHMGRTLIMEKYIYQHEGTLANLINYGMLGLAYQE